LDGSLTRWPKQFSGISRKNKEEKYQSGGWEELIQTITATWVKQYAYAGKGTIWAWGTPSVNFQH